MRLCSLLPAFLLAAAPLAAADLGQLIEQTVRDIPEEQLSEPGSPVLAERLAELLPAATELGLDPAQLLELKLRVAEARLDAEQADLAETLVKEALAAELSPVLRQRAGLALVAAWELRLGQAEKPEELPDPVQALAALGEFDAQVRGRALAVRGQHLAFTEGNAAQAAYLEALQVLKDEDPRTRVPVYALLVVQKERDGENPEAVLAWLEGLQADPAVGHVINDVLAEGEQMIGKPAPPLAAKRLDVEGAFDLAQQQGKQVLVYFFATWCGPCAQSTPAVVRVAQTHPDLVVVGVSLDTKDSLPNLAEYRQRYGVTYPLIGESLGWDGELDDNWYLTGIPSLFLVSPEGKVVATDLVKADTEATVAAIEAAIRGEGPLVPEAAEALEAPIP